MWPRMGSGEVLTLRRLFCLLVMETTWTGEEDSGRLHAGRDTYIEEEDSMKDVSISQGRPHFRGGFVLYNGLPLIRPPLVPVRVS